MEKLILLFVLISIPIIAQDSVKVKTKSGQKIHKRTFVDKNGDGYNDNAPDHDKDGIPNGLDPDYIKLKKKNKGRALPFIDKDGDGINDNLFRNSQPGLKGFGSQRKNVQPQSSGKEGVKKQLKAGQNGNNGKGKGGK